MQPSSLIPPASSGDSPLAARLQDIVTHLAEQDRALLKMMTALQRQEDMLIQLLERKPRTPRTAAENTVDSAHQYISRIIDGTFPAPEYDNAPK